MIENQQETTLETLQEIKQIMDSSARFLSLSGMSGIWAGVTALGGAGIAYYLLDRPDNMMVMGKYFEQNEGYFDPVTTSIACLALGVFIVALAGACFFTWQKARKKNLNIWNKASRQMMFHGFFPMFVGALFCLRFIYFGYLTFIVPSCLVFYGLAVLSASKFTVSDIKYLGVWEILLGCISLFVPNYALLFWAAGFGVLHILYGAIMWSKYDKVSK